MKRLLICLTWPRIGDYLLITPVIAAIRTHLPDAYIALLVNAPEPGGWLENLPLVDDVITYSYQGKSKLQGIRQAARKLRRLRFDAAIYRGQSGEVAWMLWLAGIPMRIAGPYKHFQFLLTHACGSDRKTAVQHEVEYNMELLSPLGIRDAANHLCFPIPARDLEEADRTLQDFCGGESRQLIAVNLGTGGTARLWPAERFIEVADQLVRQGSARIVVVGNDYRVPPFNGLATAMRPCYLDLTGKTTLTQLGAILKHCALHISVDTGTTHMAAAMNTPSVTIYSDGQAWDQRARWRPWQVDHRLLGPTSRCAGCERRCHRSSRDCIDSISPAQVASAATDLLAAAGG